MLNQIEEENNLIHENIQASAANDQGNDTLSGEFSFASVVYVESLKTFTRNYGKNLLFAKCCQIQIFDLLFTNVNMTQEFLNSFFFYVDKMEFKRPQKDFKFSLEERWGNAYIEITAF